MESRRSYPDEARASIWRSGRTGPFGLFRQSGAFRRVKYLGSPAARGRHESKERRAARMLLEARFAKRNCSVFISSVVGSADDRCFPRDRRTRRKSIGPHGYGDGAHSHGWTPAGKDRRPSAWWVLLAAEQRSPAVADQYAVCATGGVEPSGADRCGRLSRDRV